MRMPRSHNLESLETRLLIDGIQERYGYDLSLYREHLVRDRILSVLYADGLRSVSRLTEKILRDEKYFDKFLGSLSQRGSRLFDDPVFFETVRRTIIPFLRTYPSIRIWQVGANAGDLYSLAILLEEEGLYDRTRIYTTDISTATLAQAKKGTLPFESLIEAETLYRQAGGHGSVRSYFMQRQKMAVASSKLKRNVVFFHYNPSTDGSLNEFHFILCRGLIDDFGPELQQRVVELFYSSLCPLGMMAIGFNEPVIDTRLDRDFAPIVHPGKLESSVGLYQRVS